MQQGWPARARGEGAELELESLVLRAGLREVAEAHVLNRPSACRCRGPRLRSPTPGAAARGRPGVLWKKPAGNQHPSLHAEPKGQSAPSDPILSDRAPERTRIRRVARRCKRALQNKEREFTNEGNRRKAEAEGSIAASARAAR